MMAEQNTSDEQMEVNPEEVEVELSEVEQLQLQVEEAVDAKLRALADFKNYQRRSTENEIRAGANGMARVVRAIVPSIEQMGLAIEHASDEATVQGIEMARNTLLQGLADCGVEEIKPEVGDVFDPKWHEALMRQDSEEFDADHVVMVMQTGFSLGDIVITPAKVAVSS